MSNSTTNTDLRAAWRALDADQNSPLHQLGRTIALLRTLSRAIEFEAVERPDLYYLQTAAAQIDQQLDAIPGDLEAYMCSESIKAAVAG